MVATAMKYPFTEAEFNDACERWGCNCGPSALAFALQVGLDKARCAIPGFDVKRYTSPSMMKAAMMNLKKRFIEHAPQRYVSGRMNNVEQMFPAQVSLVRIQWCGPWTEPGAAPKWAYRQTHWITTYKEMAMPRVFDCNGGITTFTEWESVIAPFIMQHVPRCNGQWFPTHIWELR